MKALLLGCSLLLACGCNDTGRMSGSGSAAHSGSTNTATNERDRHEGVKTPIDQNENRKDIDITANIRSRVVKTNTSTNAHNVKIITQDGRVTLRGPVKTADEKKQIEDIAFDVAGKSNVDSQLEVEPAP